MTTQTIAQAFTTNTNSEKLESSLLQKASPWLWTIGAIIELLFMATLIVLN